MIIYYWLDVNKRFSIVLQTCDVIMKWASCNSRLVTLWKCWKESLWWIKLQFCIKDFDIDSWTDWSSFDLVLVLFDIVQLSVSIIIIIIMEFDGVCVKYNSLHDSIVVQIFLMHAVINCWFRKRIIFQPFYSYQVWYRINIQLHFLTGESHLKINFYHFLFTYTEQWYWF